MARNTNIKLRRSATSGAIPTTANLDLGELAINTYDGKLFLKKNVSGTESIVEIGSSTESQEAVWTEYVYTATASQTTFVGSDDNSNTLSYTPLFLQVFLNGVLLDNGTDYTATSGSSVVLVNAAAAGDLLQVASFVKVIGDGDIVVNSFTGDGSTAAYTLTANPDTEDNTTVFVDGVYQEKDTYTVSGTTLTFDANVPNGASIEILIGSRNVTLSNIADLSISGDLVVDDGARSLTYDVSAGELNHAGATFHINKSNGVDVAIGNDDFYVDMSTSRVGIGTTSPSYKLSVSGNIGLTDGVSTASHALVGGNYYIQNTGAYSTIFQTAGIERARIDSSGKFGIGTTSPASNLHIKTSVDNSLSQGLVIERSANTDRGYINYNGGAFQFRSTVGDPIVFGETDSEHLRVAPDGNVGIGTNAPNAKLQVEEYGIDTTETSTTATTQVAIHTMAAATFRSARFTVQVTNSTDSTYHLTEILMIHDGTTPSITEYGTIFTGSAEATFDADISSGNVRLLATPASTDSMEFKVICHSITV